MCIFVPELIIYIVYVPVVLIDWLIHSFIQPQFIELTCKKSWASLSSRSHRWIRPPWALSLRKEGSEECEPAVGAQSRLLTKEDRGCFLISGSGPEGWIRFIFICLPLTVGMNYWNGYLLLRYWMSVVCYILPALRKLAQQAHTTALSISSSFPFVHYGVTCKIFSRVCLYFATRSSFRAFSLYPCVFSWWVSLKN